MAEKDAELGELVRRATERIDTFDSKLTDSEQV